MPSTSSAAFWDVAEIMLSGVGMIPGLDTLCGNLNLFDLRMLDYYK